eukprot:Awhi_evm1s5674
MPDSSKDVNYEAYRSSKTDLTVNLNYLLQDRYSTPFDLGSFKKYVAERYCTEMIEFIIAVQNLSNEKNVSSVASLKPRIQEIYQRYVDKDSPYLLNLNSDTYESCQTAIKNMEEIDLAEVEEGKSEEISYRMVESIFHQVYEETILHVKENLFFPFCKRVMATQSLRLARFEAF